MHHGFDAVNGVFLFLECGKVGKEIDIVHHLFPDHPFFCDLLIELMVFYCAIQWDATPEGFLVLAIGMMKC